MNIFNFIKEIISPVTKLVDAIHVSDEERAELSNKFAELEFKIQEKMIELYTKEMEARSKIITTEMAGASFLQRNWRPFTMLIFDFIIMWNYIFTPIFNLKSVPIPEQMWTLLIVGLGGYVGGRTIEKVVPKYWDKKK